MKAIMGLVQPRAGQIIVNRPLGYVPQYEAINWDFPVTVRDVVMMGRTRHYSWLKQRRWEQQQAIESALARVGLSDLADRQVGELSGGQRRRTFIARALAQEADVLLLDEPFSGVDASAQASLMDVLDSLNRDGITILLSTHDLGLAFRRFSTVMALTRRLIAYGTPQEVYTPDILSQLYGGRLATLESGGNVSFFVDDHACDGC
jgi:ABC-type Mn2+/Zn2+ transport system ATPase subunit